jgi:hypothetical protein
MNTDPIRLYWRDISIGYIYDAGWTDFPWAGGRFVPTETDCEVRELLQWFHEENKKDDPDLTLAPYPERLFSDWFIVKPDGAKIEIMPPIPDFDNMTIEWR